jgi:hypothetical protein
MSKEADGKRAMAELRDAIHDMQSHQEMKHAAALGWAILVAILSVGLAVVYVVGTKIIG